MFRTLILATLFICSHTLATEWPIEFDSKTPLSGKIWDTQKRHFITPEQFTVSVLEQDWLFIGENHENESHHEIETAIINHFAEEDQLGHVAFEMANQSQQTQLDQYLGYEFQPEDIGWTKGWPWDWYEAPVTAALSNAKRVLGTDLTRPQQMKAYLDESTLLPSGPYRDFMDDILFTSHCGKLPRSQLANMLRVQIARDKAMAKVIDNGSTDKVDIFIAGSMHARLDTGVPLYSSVKSTTLLLVAAGSETDPKVYFPKSYSAKPVADFILFTPEITPKDHCADFK